MKKLLMFLLSATVMLSFAGCQQQKNSQPETAEATEAAETTEIEEVILGTSPWPTNMLYYLAEEKGIFEKNGVKVNIQEFKSTTESTNAFAGGKLDFCTFASPETVPPFYQNCDFSVVLQTDKSNGCDGLVASSDIKTIEDLKGKTVATQLYSVDHMLLLTMLDEYGLSEDDVNIVDMTIQESGNAFIAGQVDAACIWDPYLSQALAAGGNLLFSSADNPEIMTDVLCASNDVCSSNPQAVEAIVKSFFEAAEYWRNNPEETNEFMGEKLGVDAEEFANEMDKLLILDAQDNVKSFTEADDYCYWGYTQNVISKFMYDLGILDNNDKDCGDMINSEFINNIASE